MQVHVNYGFLKAAEAWYWARRTHIAEWAKSALESVRQDFISRKTLDQNAKDGFEHAKTAWHKVCCSVAMMISALFEQICPQEALHA